MAKDMTKMMRLIKDKERERAKYDAKILDFDKKINELSREKNKLRDKILKLQDDIFEIHIKIDKEQE